MRRIDHGLRYIARNEQGRTLRMGRETPTTRTLKDCRGRGRLCQIAEYYAFGKRHDLFGFIDIVALDQVARQIVAIQCTSGDNFAARDKKIRGECARAAQLWLLGGGTIELWGWRQLKKEGWQPRIKVYTLADFRQD